MWAGVGMDEERRRVLAERPEGAGPGAEPAAEPVPRAEEDVDVFRDSTALFGTDLARREANLSSNIKVGYRAPRGVKPHGWLGSAVMMGVEAWLSCINWSVLYGFHQSVFWHFTGARRYSDVLCGDATRPCDGISAGVGWGAAAACSVVLLPLVLEVPPVLRFVTARHNLLTLSTAVLLSATVVTDIVGSGEAARTVLLGAGSACVMLSLAAVASCPAVNPRLRRQPWAVVLGLLILLCIRFGRASAHPLLQAEGTRTLAVKVAGCVTALCCSFVIIKEGKGCCARVDRHPEEEMAKLRRALNKLEQQYASMDEEHKLSSELSRVSTARASTPSPELRPTNRRSSSLKVDGQESSRLSLHPELGTEHKDYRKMYEKYTNVRSKLQLYKMTARDNDYGRLTKGWLWILIGPPLASALALTLWLFTSAGIVGRIVGVAPFRHSAGLLLIGMCFGLGLNGLLTMHGVLLQLWAAVLVCSGMALLLHADNDGGYAGGVLLAVALPSIWWITLGSVRKLALHGAIGRVFGCAALFLWFYLLLYSAAEAALRAKGAPEHSVPTPIFGSMSGLQGTLAPFGWIVSGVWVFCTLVEWLVDYRNGQASYQQQLLQQQRESSTDTPDKIPRRAAIKIEKPQLCRLHKQSLWKPFLSAWMPAVVVMAIICLCLLTTVLVWNASQMWLVDTAYNLDDALSDTNFTIATFNVAGGYDSVGADSTACVAHLLQQVNGDGGPDDTVGMGELGEYIDFTTRQRLRSLPLLIGLQESDTVKWTRGNRDLLGSIARLLSLHEFLSFGAQEAQTTKHALLGQRSGSGGISTLSQLPFSKHEVVPFVEGTAGATDVDGNGGSSRVFTCVQVDLGRNVTLSLINAQLGFSADGATQRSQIEQLVEYAQSDAANAAGPDQPVVITADMRLFADGKSTDPPATAQSAWRALLDAGFRSVTPIDDSEGERVEVVSGGYSYFQGAATTIDFGASTSDGTGEPLRDGLQVDYIWYKGLELAVGDHSLPARFRSVSKPGAWLGGEGWAVPHATLCDEDECTTPVQLEENLGLGHWTAPLLVPAGGDDTGAQGAAQQGRVVCSYHRPIVAAFRRP